MQNKGINVEDVKRFAQRADVLAVVRRALETVERLRIKYKTCEYAGNTRSVGEQNVI